MADRSAITITFAENTPTEALNAVWDLAEFEAFGKDNDAADYIRGNNMTVVIEEAPLGDDDDIFTGILNIIENGIEDEDGVMQPVQDFAFTVLQDPKYGYNGYLRKHTPGLDNFGADATAEGQVILSADSLTTAIDSAPDLPTLKRWVARALGKDHAL